MVLNPDCDTFRELHTPQLAGLVIFGISQNGKQLNFRQTAICPCRGWYGKSGTPVHRCPHYGYTTTENFRYCPECGHLFE